MIKIIYLFFASIVSLSALAWNPFSSHNDNEEIPLSSEELKKVQENAGWTKDDDKTLIFEVHNDLKAPIACSGAQVELNVEWARRCGSKAIFQAMHPGWVDTPGVVKSLPLFHSITKPVLRSAEAGADTIVWLADVDAKELGSNGGFWLAKIPGTSASRSERDRLWQWCEDNSGSGRQHS